MVKTEVGSHVQPFNKRQDGFLIAYDVVDSPAFSVVDGRL